MADQDEGGPVTTLGTHQELDLGTELIENRVQLRVLSRIINRLIAATETNITQEEVDRIKEEVIAELNREYPQLDIERK